MSNLAIALRFSSAAGLSVADKITVQIDTCPEELPKMTPERIVNQQLEGIKEFRDALVNSVKQMQPLLREQLTGLTLGRAPSGDTPQHELVSRG